MDDNPSKGFTYRNMAKALMGLGRIEEARNVLKQGIDQGFNKFEKSGTTLEDYLKNLE